MTTPLRNPKRPNNLTEASPSRENAALALSALFHTSTAKKPRQDSHSASRRDKSLGTLCENFITKYEAALLQRQAKLAQSSVASDLLISIDAAAAVLGVERRRIYDIINILESLDIVSRKCKNTYVYAGRGLALTKMLGELQDKAIALFPQDAIRNEICSAEEAKEIQEKHFEAALSSNNIFSYNNTANTSIGNGNNTPKEKSLGKLSNRFIQYFLVGNTNVSLAHAATQVLNLQLETNPIISSKDGQHKTKIRRLYDIANVMLSIGLLKKMDDITNSDGSIPAKVNNKRQFFTWAWTDLKELRKSYVGLSNNLIRVGGDVGVLDGVVQSQNDSSISISSDASTNAVTATTPTSHSYPCVSDVGISHGNNDDNYEDVSTSITTSTSLPAYTPSSTKYTISEVTPTPLASRMNHQNSSSTFDAVPQQLAHI